MEKQNELKRLTNRNGYVFLDGKLQECKYLRTEYRLVNQDEDGIRNYAHDHVVQLPDGTEYCPADSELFDFVEDYEAGCIAKAEKDSESDVKVIICKFCNEAGLYKRCFGPYNIVFYTFENGVPVEHTHELTKFARVYGACPCADKWVCEDNIFPTDKPIYDSREEAFEFNSYTVKNSDGTEEQRDGVCKLLMLDPDQRELMTQFEEIAKKLEQSGVRLVANFEENFSAYNLRHVYDFNLDDSYNANDETNGWEAGERSHRAFDINLPIQLWADDYEVYIKRNETNKEKQA